MPKRRQEPKSPKHPIKSAPTDLINDPRSDREIEMDERRSPTTEPLYRGPDPGYSARDMALILSSPSFDPSGSSPYVWQGMGPSTAQGFTPQKIAQALLYGQPATGQQGVTEDVLIAELMKSLRGNS